MLAPPSRSRLRRETGIVGLLAGLLTFPVLGWLRAGFSVPYDYDGDASFYLMIVRNLRETGGYLTNPQVGFPHGGQLYDLPHGGDHLNLLLLRLFGLVLEPGAAVNLFYLLGYVAAAASAFYVLRRLGAHLPFAAVGALLFAFMPYHLLRGEAHLLLSSYWLVPVAVLFVLTVMGEEPPFVASRRRWWPGWRIDGQARWVVAGCVAIGSTGTYYAVFFSYLAVVVGAIVSLARRHSRHLWSAVLMAATTMTVQVLNALPTLVYWWRNGQNPAVLTRRVQETEEYGLRIQQLFLPRADHRIGTLARWGYRAFAGPIVSEPGSYLGVVVAGGFAVAVVTALISATGGSSPRGRLSTMSNAGLIAVVAMITATVSGLSYLLALGGLNMIRGWNRISIVLAFLGAIGLALGLTIATEHLRFRRGERLARWAAAVVSVALFAVGMFDQTAPNDADRRDRSAAAWRNDRDFYRSMAAELPVGSAVFQFPDIPFPEGGEVRGIGLYDSGRGYIHAPELKWSFGAMVGRVPKWPADLAQRPPLEIARFLVDQGFSAIVVDRNGYEDRGVAFIDSLWAISEPVSSADGRYVWFDLRALPAA